ncbi:MAG: FAD-dependent oxidoreductase, partial [Bacilli bacterium]
ASFIDKNTIQIKKTDGTVENVRGERIFINTGSRPFLPPIPGLKESHFVYTSESLMNLSILPKRLLVLGGGYIGLEFASYYNNFGSEVTVLQDGETFIPKEDREIADEVEASFKERGITLLKGVKTKEVKDLDGLLQVTIEKDGKEETLEAEALLVATGRRPNIEGLHLENAKVEVSDHNNIVTDIHKKTNVDNIFAMGDVTGGFQFTYISLDDFRIVKDYLYGKGERTTENRGAIPYTVFVDPTLSRVGLSEEEAIKKGYDIGVCRLKVNTIPKAKVLKSQVGLLKAIIDKKTDLILGVHLFAVESQEMINLAKLAIDQNIPYTVLRDDIYNHPTMTEAYNDLFKNVQ